MIQRMPISILVMVGFVMSGIPLCAQTLTKISGQSFPTVPSTKGDTDIKFTNTMPKPPPNDLYTGGNSQIDLHGSFVYTPLVYGDPKSEEYFVFRDLVGLQRKTNTMSYHVDTSNFLFDPQFSHDGKSLFFRVGWPFDTYGTYDLYQWDFKKQSLKILVGGMANQYIYIAPNDQWIAYVYGGDTGGNVYSEASRLHLSALNLKTGERIKLKNDPAPYGIAWTSLKTLLFTMPPPGASTDAPPVKGEPGKYDGAKQPRYSVYEGSPEK